MLNRGHCCTDTDLSVDFVRPDMPKNIELALADVLAQLVDECHALPSEVLEILLANFSTKALVSVSAVLLCWPILTSLSSLSLSF